MKKSNVRLLTRALAVVSVLAPVGGYPLGIGEIKLHSALNENLNAEIALTLSGESVSDIKVNLAPPEKFDEAGVSWTYFLSKIKFETITQSNGSAIIKLTSKEALKEPFLDFLLEVSWPKGNLYREFTVLVDPPAVYNQADLLASTSAENYAQAPTAKSQSHANGQTSEGQYGPTLENDTLWSVADRVRSQSDVSVEQMMMALYEANPDAFYKGNVFALTAGKTLKIPDREAVLKLSRNQALAEFNRHKKAWANRSGVASDHAETAKKKPASSGAEGGGQRKAEAPADNQLTLLAPTKAAVADNAAVTSGQAKAGKKTAGATTDAAIESRVAELEKQLAMMQELIALKDRQLAALQNQSQSQASPEAQAQPASAEATAAKPVDQATPAPQQAATEAANAGQPTASVQPNEPVQVVQPAEPAQSAQPAQPVQSVEATQSTQPAQAVPPVESAQTTQPPQVVPPVKPAQPEQPAKPAAQPVTETGGLLDPYYLGLGGVGAAFLTLLGWLWWRKRKVEEETNTESMFASTILIEEADAENISVPVVEDSASVQERDAGTVGESSFLSEFTPSDFDSFDTDQGEIDPISEADVYLAYGRYQQAEELIRQAIIDQPNRDECKLKLLEVFYANENQAAFEAYANELAEAGKRNDVEFWEKAAEMGREICPDSLLFSSGSELFAVADNLPDENSDEGVVVAVDTGLKKEDTDAGTASFGESAGTDDEDFSGETVKSEADTPDVGVASLEAEGDSFIDEAQNNEDIDFDLGSFSMDPAPADQNAIAAGAQAEPSLDMQLESVDFDLSSFSMDTKASDEAGPSSNAQLESIDFDLGAFSLESDKTGQNTANVQADSPSSAGVESVDFDLDSFSMGSDAEDQGVVEVDTTETQASEVKLDDLDFDLGSFSMDSNESKETKSEFVASAETSVANKEMEFDSLEFDFSGLGEGDKKRQDDTDSFESGSLNFNDDLGGSDFDFDFDLDLPSTAGSQDSGENDVFGVSDLTDMDEMETKLDLAKAYVDMGDTDAAKEIAQEVLEQGSAEQKKVAQALLDELN